MGVRISGADVGRFIRMLVPVRLGRRRMPADQNVIDNAVPRVVNPDQKKEKGGRSEAKQRRATVLNGEYHAESTSNP